MNIPYYIEFLHWKLSCGTSDSNLKKNVFIVLQLVEQLQFVIVGYFACGSDYSTLLACW